MIFNRLTTMHNIKYRFAALVLLIGLSMSAQNKMWTLQECVTHALENNISIQRGENSLLINEQDIKEIEAANNYFGLQPIKDILKEEILERKDNR